MTIVNRRVIYLAQDWAPDGLKVAANGVVVTATGNGVDVLDVSDGSPCADFRSGKLV
jgi:hypothetical protein